MKLGYLKVHYLSRGKRPDFVVSLDEMSYLNAFVCINNGRLKTVEKGQNHPYKPSQKRVFATSPSADLRRRRRPVDVR